MGLPGFYTEIASARTSKRKANQPIRFTREVRNHCDVVRSENRTQVSMFDVLYRHKNVAFSKCQNLMNEQRVKDKSTGVFFCYG